MYDSPQQAKEESAEIKIANEFVNTLINNVPPDQQVTSLIHAIKRIADWQSDRISCQNKDLEYLKLQYEKLCVLLK